MSNRVLFPSLLDRLSQLKLTRYLQMDVFFLSFYGRKKFSEPIIALLNRVDLLMVQTVKIMDMFSHCGVLTNLL